MSNDKKLKAMVDAIIDAYHTTRLSTVSAADHVLSKPYVKKAIDEALGKPSS